MSRLTPLVVHVVEFRTADRPFHGLLLEVDSENCTLWRGALSSWRRVQSQSVEILVYHWLLCLILWNAHFTACFWYFLFTELDPHFGGDARAHSKLCCYCTILGFTESCPVAQVLSRAIKCGIYSNQLPIRHRIVRTWGTRNSKQDSLREEPVWHCQRLGKFFVGATHTQTHN